MLKRTHSHIGTSVCWRYNHTREEWSGFGHLSASRKAAAAMQFPDGYVMIVGGSDSSFAPSAYTEKWTPDGGFELGPKSLPKAIAGHCVAMIDNNTALLTAGQGGGDKVLNTAYMYDRSKDKWSKKSSMKTARYHHGCGVVDKSKVVVAGGFTVLKKVKEETKSVEIFDLATETWSDGPALPESISRAFSIQLENNVVLVSGSVNFMPTDTLLSLDLEENEWVIGEKRLVLVEAMSSVSAGYLLPKTYLNCV